MPRLGDTNRSPWAIRKPLKAVAVILFFAILIAACFMMKNTYSKTGGYGERSIALSACPDTPNCVSSLDDRPKWKVEPFPLEGSPSQSLSRLEAVVRSMPRTRVIRITGNILQTEFRTRLGFVDDVTFALDADAGVIQVRSASRIGYWDFGVNRRRVEKIRKLYEQVDD